VLRPLYAIAKKGCFVFDSSTDAAASGSGPHLDCTLAAVQTLAVGPAELPGMRGRVSAQFAGQLSVGVIKQLEEQSVLALLTLKLAIDQAGMTAEDLDRCGLIACARTPGRKRIGESLVKFRDSGAWSMSPHVIPYLSLHSLPGLLSQGLRLHGPNIGAGGLPGSESEALWAAMALLHGDQLPGVFVVLTGWNEHECQCVTLCLQRLTPAAIPQLRFRPGQGGSGQRLTLESLRTAIESDGIGIWELGGASLALRLHEARLEAAA